MAGGRPGSLLRGLASLAVALAVGLTGGLARADKPDFAAALSGLADPSSDAVASAARSISDTEDPRALGVLEALADGDVAIGASGRVYLRDSKAALRDAATGAPAAQE